MALVFLHALLYLVSFAAIIFLFGSVIAAIWWTLKIGLGALVRLIRAITDE
jgi:hypothetical protein